MKTARGPDRLEMADHPRAGANLRRVENPMSAAGRGSEGRTTRISQAAKARAVW